MEMTQVIPKNGLLGYFFEENNFQSLLFISNGSFTHTKIQPNLDFVRPEQTVQSVRWLGRIKPKRTGKYLFTTSDNNYIVLQIKAQNGDEKRVIDLGERNVMELEADTWYVIRLEYQLPNPMHIEDTNLSLSWQLKGQKQELIPDECMYLPDFTKGSGITNLSSTLFRLEASGPDNEEKQCIEICVDFPCEPECQKPACQTLLKIDHAKCCKDGEYDEKTCGIVTSPKTEPPKTEPQKTEQQELEDYVKKLIKEHEQHGPQEIYDTDNDFIPDYLEIHGYTTELHIYEEGKSFFKAYPWRTEYDQDPRYSNYQKYVSNPFIANTAGDPYTDLEKAGRSLSIQGKILEEAYHPLVAACPSAAVFMEDMTISPKITTEMEMKSGVSYHTNYGIETLHMTGDRMSVSQGTHLEFNGDLEGYRKSKGKKTKGFGIHASGQAEGSVYISETLTHSNEQTVTTTSTVQDTHTLSETERTTMDSMDSGIVSGVIRYRNMGTAPMEQIKPNLSFISGDTTVTTFTPQQEINFLEAGRAYPAEHLAGIRVSPVDLLNGHTTSLNKDQMKELTSGTPVKIQATQITGKFTGTGETPRFKMGTKYNWAEILPDITKKTARLMLDIPEDMLDRRVAAPPKDSMISNDLASSTGKESWTPRLTLEQAIQIAFGAQRNTRGELVLKTKTGMVYNLDRASVNVYVNQETDALIVKQLDAFKKAGDTTKSIYDVMLSKEMVILIKPILEINAFLNNGYLYIENQMDESMSYQVWKDDGSRRSLLKQGILPPDFTIGTGYFCGNPAEELYITVSRQVSQVIFKGKVSELTGFENNPLQPKGKALHILLNNQKLPIKWENHFKGLDDILLTFEKEDMPIKDSDKYPTDGAYFCEEIEVQVKDEKISLSIKHLTSADYHYVRASNEAPIMRQILLTRIQIECETIDIPKFSKFIPFDRDKTDYTFFKKAIDVPFFKGGKQISVPLKIGLYGYYYGAEYRYTDQREGTMQELITKSISSQEPLVKNIGRILQRYSPEKEQLLYSGVVNFNVDTPKLYDNLSPIGSVPFSKNIFSVSFYQQSEKIYLFNKSPQSVSCYILNLYQESIWEKNLEPHQSISIDFKELASWKNAVYGKNPEQLSDRIIITINQSPIFDGMPKAIPSKETMQGYVSDAVKAHTLDYWHLNNGEDTNPSYDSVCFKKIAPEYLGALTSYEVKVNGQFIGVAPIRPLELDGKILINFYDYKTDSNKHPKKGQQVEIIAQDVFGNTTSVFNGTAELSDTLWIEHYQVSEWHKKGNRFDALYLAPVPIVFIENVKSYDIKIDNEMINSVLFERPDNESYIRDQRLKLDFSKKIQQDKLPKLGDSVHLVIHTIENQTVTIDLGKIAESNQPDSINALEKVHEITKWTKDKDYYTHVQFNKGSEHIKSYVFQVNNRYYGEIPVNQATTELDLSKLDNSKKIRKGDYVEIYAYKKDGEGVLIQSRYAGTTGLLGAYPAKEKIQQEYHVTSWSKVTDSYTSFTLGPLSDPIDSYIKKYEGCINNTIINLTPNGLTFAFDTDKRPRHGNVVQMFAYTYSGDKIELWKLLAGAIGTVTDEEVRSIHTLKGWEDTNQTIAFHTSDLKDRIQTHIQSYTIEVWNGSQKKWGTFGNPIQMNVQGQLRLKECKASQLMPQPPSFVRIQANFFDSGRKPIVVMIRIVGEVKAPPTEVDIQNAHKDLIWNFEEGKLKSIKFPHIDSELARYISDYQVSKWANVIPEKSTFKVGKDGLTLAFDKPIETASKRLIPIGNEHTEERLVTDEFSAVAYWMNTEGQNLIKTLVIGERDGVKNITGVTPHPPIKIADIKAAHVIENWVYDTDNKHVKLFYFNQEKLKPYLDYIQSYSIKVSNTVHVLPKNQTLSFEPEEDENGKTTNKKGLPIRFNSFGLTGGIGKELPKANDILTVIVHLKNPQTENGNEITVISDYKIPQNNHYLGTDIIERLKKAHVSAPRWTSYDNGNHWAEIIFEKDVADYLNYVDYYCIQIDGDKYCPKNPENKSTLPFLGLEEDKFVLRLSAYQVPDNKRPNKCNTILVYVYLKEDYAPEGSRDILVYSYPGRSTDC